MDKRFKYNSKGCYCFSKASYQEHSPQQISIKCVSSIPSSHVTVNGRYGEWSQWEECSSSCDRGTRTRTRECNNPPPQYGGSACQGESSQQVDCNIRLCPSKSTLAHYKWTQPVLHFALHNTILSHSIKPFFPMFSIIMLRRILAVTQMLLHAASQSAATQKKRFYQYFMALGGIWML